MQNIATRRTTVALGCAAALMGCRLEQETSPPEASATVEPVTRSPLKEAPTAAEAPPPSTPATQRSSASANGVTLSITALEQAMPADRSAAQKEHIAAYRWRVQNYPRDERARLALVNSLIAARHFDSALEAAEAWRLQEPGDALIPRLIGDIYTELGDEERAWRSYSAALELAPDHQPLQRRLASHRRPSSDEATLYQQLLALQRANPDQHRIAFQVADAADRAGRRDEAIERFEKLIDETKQVEATDRGYYSYHHGYYGYYGGVIDEMVVHYPAKQRLAQLYHAMQREAAGAGDDDAVERLRSRIGKLELDHGGENDIRIYLTWDTDETNVDLRVTTPSNKKVWTAERRGEHGETMLFDVLNGYGPESFTAHYAASGTYRVEVKFPSWWAPLEVSGAIRGEVSIVLHEGRAEEVTHVVRFRITRPNVLVPVAEIHVERGGN